MHSNVAILASTAVAPAVRVKRDGVDGTEMTFDSPELFFEHQMEEPRVELADTCRSCRHVHSILATTQYHLHKIIKNIL